MWQGKEAHVFKLSISQGKVAADIMSVLVNYFPLLLSVATMERWVGGETNFFFSLFFFFEFGQT